MVKTINCQFVCCKWSVELIYTEAGTGAHSGRIGVGRAQPRRGVRRIMPHPLATRMGGFQHLYVFTMPFAVNKSINYCLLELIPCKHTYTYKTQGNFRVGYVDIIKAALYKKLFVDEPLHRCSKIIGKCGCTHGT